MRLTTQYLSVCTAVSLFLLSSGTFAQRTDSAPATVEKLLETESSWDGTLYKTYPDGTPQLSVLKITIPPNSSLSWHQHAIPNAAYVQNGTLTVEKKQRVREKHYSLVKCFLKWLTALTVATAEHQGLH